MLDVTFLIPVEITFLQFEAAAVYSGLIWTLSWTSDSCSLQPPPSLGSPTPPHPPLLHLTLFFSVCCIDQQNSQKTHSTLSIVDVGKRMKKVFRPQFRNFFCSSFLLHTYLSNLARVYGLG